MHTIVLDCGASFIKGAVFSENGDIIAKRQRTAPEVCRDEKPDEPVQINELYSCIEKMLTKLVNAGDVKEYKLCISNEMHGFLLADGKGNPVTDYISWQKEYGSIKVNGSSATEELRKQGTEDILYTGMNLRAGLPSCNLLYLYKTGFFYENRKNLHFYTLGDYILRRLSGREMPCHPTNAAATGLYDLRTGNWNRRLIKIYEDNGIVFPVIGAEFVEFEWRGRAFRAYPAIGDQQAALLGAGLNTKDAISFNLGTGAQVARLAEKVKPSSEYQIRPYFQGCYLKTVPHLPSGRALNVYFRFVKEIAEKFAAESDDEEIWNRILMEAESGGDTYLKCDLSFFENALTSFEKGSIENIGEYDLTLGNLFNTVFEQMADNFVAAADRLYENRKEIRKLVFSGGIARRIISIRNRILERYGENAEYDVAEDETLLGLYKYGNL